MELMTTKNSVYILILALIGVTAPFWHIFYGIRDTEGLFGYRFMSSFLNSLGTRLCILCMGLMMLFFSKQIANEYKKSARVISLMTIYVGCYFLILIVFPKKTLLNTFGIRDFHRSFYYISMVALSIGSGYLFSLIQKAIIVTEEKLKQLIRSLFDFIFIDVQEEEMIKDSKKSLYHDKSVELLKNALDNE